MTDTTNALRALVDHWRTVAEKVVDSGYATATRLCADELERALLSGGGDDRVAEIATLRDALGRAWSGLVVGGDCASMLADLQESGVYRPRCSDGKPSNADARRDYREIAATAKSIHPLAFPKRAMPTTPEASK